MTKEVVASITNHFRAACALSKAMPSKQSSKFWVFTLNNPDGLLDFTTSEAVKYAVYQEEVGDAGTPHFQGYVELHTTRQLPFMKKLIPGAHWEMRRGTQAEARDYAMKADTRVSGPYEHGTFVPAQQGARTDLLALKDVLIKKTSLKDVAEQHFPTWLKYHRGVDRFLELQRTKVRPEQVEVELHLGATGLGKTHYAIESNPGAYLKPPGEWWDGYEDQDVVIIDEYKGWLPFHMLLRVCDKYPVKVEVKGGFRDLVAKKIVITTNYFPHEWYKDGGSKYHWPAFYRRVTTFFYWHAYKSYVQTKDKDTWMDYANGVFVVDSPPPE